MGLAVSAMAGVALAIGLMVYYGIADIGDAILTAGWRGLLAICAVHAVSVVLCALGWSILLAHDTNVPFRAFLWARWLRDGIGAIMPAAGEVIAARELSLRGAASGKAGASAIVDLTAELVALLLFALLGLVLLISESPGSDHVGQLVAGLVIATVVVAGFVVAQRKGLLKFLEALPERIGLTQPWATLPEAESIHSSLQKIYDTPWRVMASIALHFAAWIMGAVEAWVALAFMGNPISWQAVVAIDSLVFAMRTVAFAVPWAAGIQEGGYVMLGAHFGLGPDVALALSLMKRAREFVIGVPVLLIWQSLVSRRMLRGHGAAR